MKPLLLRQRGKLRLSSSVSLPSHPHQAVNVLATPEMFQLQAGTPWNNPVLPQVDSFVTAVSSGQWCNLYWHAGSGSHVTTFRAGPPVSERGNGTFVPASTWMGGWNFFGFFSHLFESFLGLKQGMVLLRKPLPGWGNVFCWNLSFFNFILSWQIENGIFVQASTWMGRWMELEGHMNSSREIDVGLFSGTPCLCNRRSLANNKLLLKTIQKWHWASTKHYEELHANFTRWNTALLNLYQKWVLGSPHAIRVAKLKYINGPSMNVEPNSPFSTVLQLIWFFHLLEVLYCHAVLIISSINNRIWNCTFPTFPFLSKLVCLFWLASRYWCCHRLSTTTTLAQKFQVKICRN